MPPSGGALDPAHVGARPRPKVCGSLSSSPCELSALVALRLWRVEVIPWVMVRGARIRSREVPDVLGWLRRCAVSKSCSAHRGRGAFLAAWWSDVPRLAAGRRRCAADAQRVRGPFLRVGRNAVRPELHRPRAAAGRRGARDRDARQAAGGAAHRRADRLPGPHRAHRRHRPGADRGVLVHPVGAGPPTD